VILLALDAATYVGSVAVIRGDDILSSAEVAMRGEREERLLPGVEEVLRSAGVSVGDLERVACGAGPGSFTSLRIAASIAKGIAAARGIPLVVASSLSLVAAGGHDPVPEGTYLAVLDAMRGDYFVQRVRVTAEGQVHETGPAELLARPAVDRLAADEGATLIGPGELVMARPHARGFARLNASRVELATWEPTYGRLAEAQVKWEAAHGRPLGRA
jgi:tRNA threonylcarbamoyladenosine biosynthesis protein TsaB